MSKNNIQKAMAFSGGGAHTISYIGVWKYIHDDMGFIPDLITGTSGGALFGCFMAAGFDAKDIKDTLIEMKPWEYFPVRPMKWITNLFSEWGALDIEKIRSLLSEIFDRYDINWESFEKTKFRCVTSDLTDGKHKYIPNHLKMPLEDAVCASIAIPIVFEPIWYPKTGDRHCFVDGGLCEGFPIRCALDQNENIKIFAMSPFDPKLGKKNSIKLGFDYPKAMYTTLLNSQKEMTLQFLDEKRGDIEFYCGSKAKNSLDFNKETIEKNFQIGYEAALKHKDSIDNFFKN